ncbi:helix-turn-helix domain-containing protein (plasmid) [Serratia marcescens]|nr:helix-turn-helix domain-containing protein [Serratia marcescens]
MAKLPAKSKTAIAPVAVPQKTIDKVNNLEMQDFKVTRKGGLTTISGFSEKHNKHVQFQEYEAPGIKQQAVIMVDEISIAQRIIEAKRLTADGHTQQEIADMLGVSQKTISNDLKK